MRKPPIQSKCAYCYLRDVDVLDHYFDKSTVPTLSISTDNLVPICNECNLKKGNQPYRFVNPYFETVYRKGWLDVSVTYTTRPWKFRFTLQNVDDLPDSTFDKLKKQLDHGDFFNKLHDVMSPVLSDLFGNLKFLQEMNNAMLVPFLEHQQKQIQERVTDYIDAKDKALLVVIHQLLVDIDIWENAQA